MEKDFLYQQHVLPIIRSVGGLLLPHYGTASFQEKGSKGLENIVTTYDIEVENILKKELYRLYPDISFVGEEHGGDRTAEKFWLADPIDGTSYYVRGLPFCSSMLALVDKGEVIFSVIYDFVRDIAYYAEKGKGAYANNTRIEVSARSLREARIAWYIDLNNEEHLHTLQRLVRRCHPFHTGASGIEFALIASGKIDGTISIKSGSKDYDIAPGTFLVREAGGVVANIGKRTYDYRNLDFIATNPVAYRELTEGSDALFPTQS